MPQLGAGLLMYRDGNQGPEVLLVHPGGPFFKDKDEGVWSLPKGLADDGEVGEQLLDVAKREFEEETGVKPVGPFDYLGSIRRRSDGKTVAVWAFEGDCDPATVTSNKIIIEWPPRTGMKLEIPEVDRAAFFTLEHARTKLSPYLAPLIDIFEKYFASRQIAHLLRIHEKTVSTYRARILLKLNASTLVDLIRYGVEERFVD